MLKLKNKGLEDKISIAEINYSVPEMAIIKKYFSFIIKDYVLISENKPLARPQQSSFLKNKIWKTWIFHSGSQNLFFKMMFIFIK